MTSWRRLLGEVGTWESMARPGGGGLIALRRLRLAAGTTKGTMKMGLWTTMSGWEHIPSKAFLLVFGDESLDDMAEVFCD